VLQGKHTKYQAPLVLANILAPVIIKLFDDGLHKLMLPGGVLILSGILEEQEERVLMAAKKQGLEMVLKNQIGDWVSLAIK